MKSGRVVGGDVRLLSGQRPGHFSLQQRGFGLLQGQASLLIQERPKPCQKF